ncbi:putative heterokaryon incompatibility protein [Colletotrichum sublineola]|uniref:Putative heterokaryon incompatibility protein n=1 Tax=Colletotrichum sublineola TaxID=1173701 RepID=A0A066XW95_COLSU|nr:putative heterokaryon incompatibility protein [Colletotrichum sublineola]
MRVLNVHTLRLEELYPVGDSPPTYAILSHRWEKDIRDEVLYEDVANATNIDTQKWRQKRGFAKVDGACKQAAKDGYDHIWIDSCCINQNSSAELSESINSMYRFYQEAQVCYAFLAGLPPPNAGLDTDESFERHDCVHVPKATQELIAPATVLFFTDELVGQSRTTHWIYIADKASICEKLSAITNIDAPILKNEQPVGQASVAKRMSWAAKRVTTKPEDHAYSLMGLFDVNMPMIYGEGGTKAFLRLQEEIIKVSSDQSIFAWRDSTATPGARTGVLATSPKMCKDCGGFFGYYDWDRVEPFSKTNRGLQITLPLRLVKTDTFVAALNCSQPTLAPMICPDHILQLRKGPDPKVGWTLHGVMGLRIASQEGLKLHDSNWVPKGLPRAFQLPKEQWRLAAVLVFTRPNQTRITILLGSGINVENVSIQIVDGYRDLTFGEWQERFQPEAHSRTNPWNLGRELVYINVNWQYLTENECLKQKALTPT